ncbi:MAG: ATP-binding protein [Bacilli bacterium]|nr:ATP-binding protein [Bacilli bacterium]
MIERKVYLSKLIASKENGFPKVITGVRRCGKSYLLSTIFKNYLISTGVNERNIITFALDEDENVALRNPIELGKNVRKICQKNVMNYVIIDEIQLVDTIINPIYTNGKYIIAKKGDENTVSFIDVVLGLSREPNIDLYVTGSNSKMLSTDIITEFRDKATNIMVKPLSFDEFYLYRGGAKSEALYEYMVYGGMPLAVTKSEEDRKEYLKSLFEKTYFIDILERNKVEKPGALNDICTIISQECGQLINATKISNTFKSNTKDTVSKETVEKYIGYLTDSFLISEATRFDIKGRTVIGASSKYYFIDNGLRNARLNFAFFDEGQMLENIVYNELLYNGYSVNVGMFEKVEKNKEGKSVKKSYEMDFLAKRGIKQYYIQVASNIATDEIKSREIRPFIAIKDQIQKVLVVNMPLNETVEENGFTVIGITDFLLRFIK